MIRNFAFDCKSFFKKYAKQELLCGVWLLGLLSGGFLYCCSKPPVSSWMCSLLVQPVSIVGLVMVLFLPYFLTCLSFLINRPLILMTVCYIKAASYFYTLCVLYHLFDSAAWIIGVLSLFSDSLFMIVLFSFWLTGLKDRYISHTRAPLVCLFTGLLIAASDLYIISPYLQGLF